MITGGAGYVGAELVPVLLHEGHRVSVLDLYLYGDDILEDVRGNPNLNEVKGDLRDSRAVRSALEDCDAVIHLACISNDPSFELDSDLSKTINFDAFEPLVKESKAAGVERFIYASTSSVYGVSNAPDVRENHPLVPLTDYNKFKGMCEPVLLREESEGFVPVVIRPSTVCGFSRRMRLDLTVNILTSHAINNRKITVFGGDQMRPNLHIKDMCDLYKMLLDLPDEAISGETFNVGYQNYTINEIAEMTKNVVEEEMPELGPIAVERTPSTDPRSYHVNSDKIREMLGFYPQFTVEDAVRDLCSAFKAGKFPKGMTDTRYFNVKLMKDIGLH